MRLMAVARLARQVSTAMFLGALLSSCGGGTEPVVVATVEVSPTTASKLVGETVQLSATMKDAAGTILSGQPVTWSSSAVGVASVSSSGLVTAAALGTAVITAASGSKSGIATVTVVAPPNPCSTALAPPIAVGQTIDGSLVATDCKLTDNTFADGYGLLVSSATNVQIDMTASFDTYLILVELTSNGLLQTRAENDDVDPDDPNDPSDPIDTNSRIVFALQPNAQYFILANSFDPNTFGNYQLKVTAVAPTVAGRTLAGKPGKSPVASLLKAIKPK